MENGAKFNLEREILQSISVGAEIVNLIAGSAYKRVRPIAKRFIHEEIVNPVVYFSAKKIRIHRLHNRQRRMLRYG